MSEFLQKVARRLFGVERLLMVVCWEFVCFVSVRKLLSILGFWVCECCLCELLVLINVTVIFIVDSGLV